MAGPRESGQAILNGVCTRVLIDDGARVNSVTPAYVQEHRLGVRAITELDHTLNPFGNCILLVGLGRRCMEPLGYILVQVQMEGMPHCDEQQVAFILDDPSRFSTRIPVVLGTPTINWVIQKESKFDSTPLKWCGVRVTYKWAHGIQSCQTMLNEKIKFPTNSAQDLTDLDEKILLTDKCLVTGFESFIIHSHMQNTMMMGHPLNIMTQAPYPEDKTELPNGLYVIRIKRIKGFNRILL